MQITRTLTDNPIFRAELAHQGRAVPRRRPWLRRLLRWILYLAFALAFLFAGMEFAAAAFNFNPDPVLRFLDAARILPVAVAIALHFSLMLQTLARSSDSIARERISNNWDTLVLTGIDARQIIRGKWWATVRHMWPAYIRLAVLRALVIVWVGAEAGRTRYSYYQMFANAPEQIPPSPLYFILAAVLVVAMTMANLAFTAACGVSAISAHNRGSAAMLGRAIATRLLILLGLVIVGFVTLGRVFQLNYELYIFYSNLFVTLLDNGATLGNALVSWRVAAFSDTTGYTILSAFVNVGFYLLLTYALLRLAQRLAVRNNALPPLRVKILETPLK